MAMMANADAVAAIDARIERLPLSRWHVRLVAILGSANLFDTFDATTLAFALPVLVGLWRLTPVQTGVLLAAGSVGQLLGAVVAGALAERFGRIPVLRGALGLFAAMSVGCGLAAGYSAMLALRVVQGMGLGAEVPIAATYLNEASSARFRGRLVGIIQWTAASGGFVGGMLAAVLIPAFGWRSLFFVGALPLVLAVALKRLLPESARWLAHKGRLAQADAVVTRLEAAGPSRGKAVGPGEVAAAPLDGAAASRSGFGALFAPGRSKATLSAWAISFFGGAVGYGIIYWMPTLYRTVYHQPVNVALKYAEFNSFALLGGGSLGVLLFDRLGRKRSILLGFGGAAVFLGALAVLGASGSALQAAILSATAEVLIGLPMAGAYVYSGEIYATAVRALGVGVASAWVRMASIVGPPVIGLLLATGGARSMFLTMSVLAGLGVLATAFLATETRASPNP